MNQKYHVVGVYEVSRIEQLTPCVRRIILHDAALEGLKAQTNLEGFASGTKVIAFFEVANKLENSPRH